MKWLVAASVICCGGLLLLILAGANIGLILGVILNNWLLFLLGIVALIAGSIYYLWWRHKQRTSQYWR